MNKQLCKEIATGFGIGVSIAVSKTSLMAGTMLVVGATLPEDAYEEKPSAAQRLKIAAIGTVLMTAGAVGMKYSLDALYDKPTPVIVN